MSAGRRRWRRIVVLAVAGASLAAILSGYGGSRVFAWQMFPEASRWQADIVRVTEDGERYAITADWPGGYRWSQLVTESGLGAPADEGHAAYGIAATLDALQHALNWVAGHTPADTETLYLEAVVRYHQNDGPSQTVVLRSTERDNP